MKSDPDYAHATAGIVQATKKSAYVRWQCTTFTVIPSTQFTFNAKVDALIFSQGLSRPRRSGDVMLTFDVQSI